MRTDELDYDLPPEAIAQQPIEPRDAARLLVDAGPGGTPEDLQVRDLPSLVGPGDVVVINTTRVIPARVHLRRTTGAHVEVLLLEERGDGWWLALMRNSRKVLDGERLLAAGGGLTVVAGEREGTTRLVRLLPGGRPGPREEVFAALAEVGEMPLPPYIEQPNADPERYQTVFARQPGSAAAPTAGLHFTESTLEGVRAAGATVCEVELVIGLHTFQPISTDTIEEHQIHTERYHVPEATLEACAAADRVIAVGTTVVRALETAAATGEASGESQLYITPGFEFAVVDVLLTNFHLPRSSLLALVEAFVGPRWRGLYAEALARGYRFLSFGDAMLLRHSLPLGDEWILPEH